jgi:hypothetical protein
MLQLSMFQISGIPTSRIPEIPNYGSLTLNILATSKSFVKWPVISLVLVTNASLVVFLSSLNHTASWTKLWGKLLKFRCLIFHTKLVHLTQVLTEKGSVSLPDKKERKLEAIVLASEWENWIWWYPSCRDVYVFHCLTALP